MTRSKSFVFGILVGGVVAASTTLLSTPTTGKKYRSLIKEQIVEWKHILSHLKEDGKMLKSKLARNSREGALLVKDLTHDMKISVEDWKATVEPHRDNINEYLQQIETSLKEIEDKIKK